MLFSNYKILRTIVDLFETNISTETLADEIVNIIRINNPNPDSSYLGRLYGDIARKLTPKVSSAFLGQVFNALADAFGKKFVDPERGGKAFRFGSTRELHTVKWSSIQGTKREFIKKLLEYYLRYYAPAQAVANLKQSIQNEPKEQKDVNRAVVWAIQQLLPNVKPEDLIVQSPETINTPPETIRDLGTPKPAPNDLGAPAPETIRDLGATGSNIDVPRKQTGLPLDRSTPERTSRSGRTLPVEWDERLEDGFNYYLKLKIDDRRTIDADGLLEKYLLKKFPRWEKGAISATVSEIKDSYNYFNKMALHHSKVISDKIKKIDNMAVKNIQYGIPINHILTRLPGMGVENKLKLFAKILEHVLKQFGGLVLSNYYKDPDKHRIIFRFHIIEKPT